MTDKMTAEEEALVRRLVALGFRFTPVPARDGQLDGLAGFKGWPDRWIDAIEVHSSTSAKAVRLNPDEETVWAVVDTLKVVAEALIDLPHPNHRLAPHRALPGSKPPGLWIPGA